MIYKARHDELLDIVIFRANEQITATLEAVEMWKYSGVSPALARHYNQFAPNDETGRYM